MLVGWLLGWNPLARLENPASVIQPWWLRDLLWGTLATLPLIAALVVLDRYPPGPFRSLQKLVDDLVVPLFARMKRWQLLLLSAAAGFGEEALFRGLIQGGLAHVLPSAGGQLIAIALASIAFGLCHWLSHLYAVLALCVGVYLGMLYQFTGSLLAPGIAHGLYDFFALVYLTISPEPQSDGEPPTDTQPTRSGWLPRQFRR